MKYIGLVLLFVVSVQKVSAQIGFELGVNMADLAIKADNNKVKTTFKPGVRTGFMADMAFNEHVYLEPGLFYEMNGCKIKDQPTGAYMINTTNMLVNIEYKSGEKCGSRFFLGGGLFYDYNFSASYSFDKYGTIPATMGTFDIGGSGKSYDMKSNDIGIGLNIGYQLKCRLFGRINYQKSFTNLVPDGDLANYMRPSAISATLGYLFGRCEKRGRVGGFKPTRTNHWRGLSKGKYSTRRKYAY